MEPGILITFGIILLVIGLVSCVLPPLPGPPLAFLALLIATQVSQQQDSIPTWLLITYAIITLILSIADNFIPVWSTKRFGGTKAGIRGSFIGILIGIILSPFGGISIIICPFLGALIGELIAGEGMETALKSGIGSFIGFLLTSGIKIILVLMMAYHFFKAVF